MSNETKFTIRRNKMECYIRKNHMTINEDSEIYEVVSCASNNVIWWGTQASLSKKLGRSDWECGDTVTI